MSRLLATPSVMLACRRAAGIGRTDAARLLGMNEQALRMIEWGTMETTVDIGRQMADLYEVPFVLFFLPRVPKWALLQKRLRRWFPFLAQAQEPTR